MISNEVGIFGSDFNGKRAPSPSEDSKSKRHVESCGSFESIQDYPELIIKIIYHVTPGDLNRLHKTSSEMNEYLGGDVDSTFRRLLTPGNKAALSLEVRKFFTPNPAAPTPLYTKAVKDLTFEEIEVLLKIQQAMIATHFQGHNGIDGLSARNPLTTEQLNTLFVEAALNGVDSIVTKIIQGPRFGEISAEYFGCALNNAVRGGHEGCLRALIDCERFGVISVGNLGSVLLYVVCNSHERCLQALIDCGRFREISAWVLGLALQVAADKGHEGCLRALIDCVRFGEISPKVLKQVLTKSRLFQKLYLKRIPKGNYSAPLTSLLRSTV